MTAPTADKQMAAALGRVASGLFVVTVTRPGIETGMLASWVQQCSFDPPRVTLAVQKGRDFANLLTVDAPLTINVLEAGQTDMIAHFGRGFGPGDDAFRDVDIEHGPSGPILTEALAYLEAKIVARHPAGDHDLFLAELTAGRMLGDGTPMVHIRKNGLHY